MIIMTWGQVKNPSHRPQQLSWWRVCHSDLRREAGRNTQEHRIGDPDVAVVAQLVDPRLDRDPDAGSRLGGSQVVLVQPDDLDRQARARLVVGQDRDANDVEFDAIGIHGLSDAEASRADRAAAVRRPPEVKRVVLPVLADRHEVVAVRPDEDLHRGPAIGPALAGEESQPPIDHFEQLHVGRTRREVEGGLRIEILAQDRGGLSVHVCSPLPGGSGKGEVLMVVRLVPGKLPFLAKKRHFARDQGG